MAVHISIVSRRFIFFVGALYSPDSRPGDWKISTTKSFGQSVGGRSKFWGGRATTTSTVHRIFEVQSLSIITTDRRFDHGCIIRFHHNAPGRRETQFISHRTRKWASERAGWSITQASRSKPCRLPFSWMFELCRRLSIMPRLLPIEIQARGSSFHPRRRAWFVCMCRLQCGRLCV